VFFLGSLKFLVESVPYLVLFNLYILDRQVFLSPVEFQIAYSFRNLVLFLLRVLQLLHQFLQFPTHKLGLTCRTSPLAPLHFLLLLIVEFLCLLEAAVGTLFAPGNASAECTQLVGVFGAFGG
jgi:hypothetical protein